MSLCLFHEANVAHVTNHGAVVLFYATAIDEFLHPFERTAEPSPSLALMRSIAVKVPCSLIFSSVTTCATSDLLRSTMVFKPLTEVKISISSGSMGRPVDNAEHDICFVNIIASTLHTEGFYRILCLPEYLPYR